MRSKTTIAIDYDARKKLKKLASLLDINQGEVINSAIANFEQQMLKQMRLPKEPQVNQSIDKNKVHQMWHAAAEQIIRSDPTIQRIQLNY